MNSLQKFPGRHLISRIGSNHATLKERVERWEQDQRVARVVCLLHFEKGLSYPQISEWLRGGPGWWHRSENQVRRIVNAVRRDYQALGGE